MDGTAHPNKRAFIVGFELSEGEKSDLIAFLKSLTDETFITNPKFSDPFSE